MTIKLKFNRVDEFFGDILDIALCSGLVWAQIRNQMINYSAEYTFSVEVRPHWREGKPFPEGDSRNDWQRVDHARIEETIQLICDRQLAPGRSPMVNDTIYSYIFDAVVEGDAGTIDADTADAILQIAMFGEIVFG